MTSSKNHGPETRWDQSEFKRLKAGWSPERIVEDEKTLKEIFAWAADVPLLAQALAWAKQHDIKFFIDHQAVNVGGYYKNGMGVVALAPVTLISPATAIDTVVHEIRHAWQDHHYLCRKNSPSFNETFIKEALIEADAHAHGTVARAQYQAAILKKRRWKFGRKRALRKLKQDMNFGGHFLSWFSVPRIVQHYGDFASKYYAQFYGILAVDKNKEEGGLPKRNYEFNSEPTKELAPGRLDISNLQNVLRLGVNFSGTENYLAAMQPDILLKEILSPSLADTFWGLANGEQRKLTTELRKDYLKRKLLAENRKPRHPWP